MTLSPGAGLTVLVLLYGSGSGSDVSIWAEIECALAHIYEPWQRLAFAVTRTV